MKNKHGGKRKGSGRKQKYKEETTTMAFRVPVSLVDKIRKLVNDFISKTKRP